MSLETIGKRIAQQQARQPWLFLIAALILTALTLPGILLLVQNVEPSVEKVLPQEIEVVRTMNAMRSQYGADMIYLIVEPDPSAGLLTDSRHPAIRDYEDRLKGKLVTREHILEVQTLADIVKENNNGIIPDSLEETKQIISQDSRSQLFIDDHARFSIIQIRSDTGADAKTITRVVEAIEEDIAGLEPLNPGVTVRMTGFNTIDKRTFEIIISDFARITAVSFLFMLLFLFLYFGGSARKVALSLSVIVFGLVWTLGLTGYLGITITVVTMVAAAMIMALGIDYGIHLIHRYEELRKKETKEEALEETLEELMRAFLGSSLTTSAGFLALLFGMLPTMKSLGIILAIGITITMGVATLITPAIIILTDKREGGRRK